MEMEKTQKKSASSSSEGQSVDRISNLPNSIQSLIVSFLPLEDGIRTRVLSKEWEHIRASFSEMKFCILRYQPYTHNTKLFEDVVNHTLCFHDGSDIQKFSLELTKFSLDECDYDLSTPLILEWISFALRHNVKQLHLHFYPERLEKLPCTLFTCSILTLLSLWQVDLKLPKYFKFPMLKDLKLLYVQFYIDNPLDQLIPSCPVLEKFSMTGCLWEGQVVLNIICTTLKSLTLEVTDPTRAIHISAPNLHVIDYVTGNPPYISPESLSSLDHSSFGFSLPDISNDSALHTLCHHADTILRGLHNVRELGLSGMFFEYLSRMQNLFSRPVTSCKRLQILDLFICCTGDHVYAIFFLLKHCPSLQTLRIYHEEESTSTDMFNMERYSESQELSAGTNLKQLKIVLFSSFEGNQGELDLARHLLENAEGMKEMKIRYSHKVKEDEANQRNIGEKFLVMSKASPDVVISFR